MPQDFDGAKLAILHRGRVLSMLRDDLPSIPYPACWDLPGGGREDGEDPVTCALRETFEETGLRLDPASLCHRRQYGEHWFFVARISAVPGLRLGSEGQALRWFPARVFMDLPDGIAHLQKRLCDYLDESGNA